VSALSLWERVSEGRVRVSGFAGSSSENSQILRPSAGATAPPSPSGRGHPLENISLFADSASFQQNLEPLEKRKFVLLCEPARIIVAALIPVAAVQVLNSLAEEWFWTIQFPAERF
jgi:hypothetical protein